MKTKTQKKGRFIFRMIFFGFIALAAVTTITFLLWNWLMPILFHLPEITFWQALGVLLLSKILLGGDHGNHNFHKRNKEKYLEAKFKEKFDRAKAHHGHVVGAEIKPE